MNLASAASLIAPGHKADNRHTARGSALASELSCTARRQQVKRLRNENERMKMTETYQEFIERKSQLGSNAGFKPVWLPDFLFPFQTALVSWAIEKGRAAVFADCGL